MAADLETLTRSYWTAVQRIRGLAVPPADKSIVLADVQAIYRRDVADRKVPSLPGRPSGRPGPGRD